MNPDDSQKKEGTDTTVEISHADNSPTSNQTPQLPINPTIKEPTEPKSPQATPTDYNPKNYFFDTSEEVKPEANTNTQDNYPSSPNTNTPTQPETEVAKDPEQSKYNFDVSPETPKANSDTTPGQMFGPEYKPPADDAIQTETPHTTTANIFTNDEIPMEPVKTNNRIKWKIPLIAGATIILLGAGIFTYSALKPVGFKQFTLLNKGSRYTFSYYSDSILGTNLNTNNNQLTGNNKNLTSVAVSPIEKYTSCDQVEPNVKIVGTVSYKNSKYNICGTNQDKFTVFQANNQNIILEIYSDNKTTTISQSLINSVFASLKTN
jgi:hypothetical protein